MRTERLPAWIIMVVIMLAIIGVALWLRVGLPYGQVFVGEWIKLTGIDTYYYMRLVDNLVRHFPQLTEFDPYMQYPGGSATGSAPDFFAYLMGGIIWLVGLGHPDQHMVDVIAVYIPPALAVLTIIAVYFIGKALGSGWIGIMAAGLLAVLPGEFLNRSLLGYTDHHIAEVLFSTGMMLFVYEYVCRSEGKSLAEMKSGGRGEVAKLVVYGVLGGVSLGLYLLTWAGALLFVLILFVYLVVQSVMEHVHGRSVDYLGVLGVMVYGVGLLIYLPGYKSVMTVIALVIGIIVSALLPLLSGLLVKRKTRPVYYPAILAAAGIAIITALYFALPELFTYLIGGVVSIFRWNTQTTVLEMQPLMLVNGQFDLSLAFQNFSASLILSLLGLVLAYYLALHQNNSKLILLAIWSTVALLAALAMRRFSYYYAVNVALLSGWLCWMLLVVLNTKTTIFKYEKVRYINAAGVLMVILAILYYPALGPTPGNNKTAVEIASAPQFMPHDAWC